MENRKASYDPENMDELDMDREYIVATRNYLIGGYDGYTAFKVPEDKIIVDEENGVLVSTLYRKFFLGLKYINAFREYQAKKSVHRTKEENEERIKNLVVSAANHWRGIARQFKRHDHPDDGRDCHCVQNTQDTEIYLSSDISDRANYHCTSQSITNAFTDASRGHPSCIEAEDDENVDNYTYNENSDLTWVKRWASIAPQVEGRITRVDY
jgi:hypothetical protein